MRFNFFTDRPLDKYRKSDPMIVVSMLILWGLGMLSLYFCSRGYGLKLKGDSLYFVRRQFISSAIGFCVFFGFVSLSMETIKRFLPLLVLGSMLLCLMTFLPEPIGVERNGARRWLRLPLLGTFQPSELIKLSCVLYLANYFDKMSSLRLGEKTMFPAVLFLVAFFAVVIMQQDFSTSIFVLLLGISMFIIAGEKITWILPLSVILGPFGVIMVLLKPYRLNRIIGFFDQSSFDQTYNYQIQAARKAMASGGFWGQGFGSGLSKLGSVPEVQTDYIFAGWVEAMGFFGVLIYFAALAFFAWRVLRCSLTTTSRFASLGSFGFLIAIVGQSLMNVGVVVGVLPTTGVPLPFFSSGGTSIIITLAMCGFIVSSSRQDRVDSTFKPNFVQNEIPDFGSRIF